MSTETGHTFSDTFRCACGALVEIDHDHIRNAFTKVAAHTHRSHDCLVEDWEIRQRWLGECRCGMPVWRDRWRHYWNRTTELPHRCPGHRRVVVDRPPPIRRPIITAKVYDV